jgi:hypothetical protein
MDAFWIGFEKRAGLPRHPSVSYISSQREMLHLAMQQWLPDKIFRASAKLSGRSLKSVRKEVVDSLSKEKGTVLGTIAPGPSGKKHVYIYKPYAKRALKGKSSPSLHDVIHHETFHAKAPIIGNSEILAHIYGGVRSKPGKLSLVQPLKDLGVLFRARPGRAAAEVAAGTALGVGAKKLIDKAKESSKKDEGAYGK